MSLKGIMGLDVAGSMADMLADQLVQEYITAVIEWYPDLFRYGGMGNEELFFNGEFERIYPNALRIDRWSIEFDIKPKKSDIDFQFRMTLPTVEDVDDMPRHLWVSPRSTLADALCVALYGMNIEISGYDRQSITRRHTISNILSDE